VRIDVREGRLNPQKIKLHYFEREGSEANVVTPQIDENGRLDEWPAGFFDQRDKNLLKLI
jgi:predicted ATPase